MVCVLIYTLVNGALFETLDAATVRLQSALGRTPVVPQTVAVVARFQGAIPEPALPQAQVTAPTPIAATETASVRAPRAAVADSEATLPQEWRVPRADRRAVQSALAQLGFDPGTIDGSIGRLTRNAIRAYERSQGLPETGELTPELAARLSRRADTQAAASR